MNSRRTERGETTADRRALCRSNLGRKLIQERRQHVVGDVALELFHSPEVLLAGRTSGLNDLVLWAHERREIVRLYFLLNGF
jgi:hypothetical protein